MRFRAGCVYVKGKRFRDMTFIKVIQRNCSRSDGMVRFVYHNSSDTRVHAERPQKLKGYKPMYGY